MNKLLKYFLNKVWKYRHAKWWMPDKWYLEVYYEKRTGKELNLKNPQTLSEKQQWLKLHDRNPLYTILADKYLSKDWMREHFGDNYVVPCLAHYNTVEEININDLPDQFVIKCNHDSGSVFLCKDKSSGKVFDKNEIELYWDDALSYLKKALTVNYFYLSREWPYKNIKPLIMVEPLMLTKDGNLPIDFKLFFANGEFLFTYVSYRRGEHSDRCMYDLNWHRLPFVYASPMAYKPNFNTTDISRPEQYDKMIEIGKKIGSYCKFARVDFFDIDGKIKIGEVTFFHGGGCDRFYPDKYDLIFGQKLQLK